MATNSNSKSEKLEQQQQEEEEDIEALSLCDLPVNFMNGEDKSTKADSQVIKIQEEFDFCSAESEMCAADEVFFQGQILPLRSSFSSDSGFSKTGLQHDNPSLNRCESRSESMDNGSTNGSQSNSSRSSSLRSQNSSCSTSSTRISKPSFQIQFHTHPSPKPQLRLSGPRQSFGDHSRKSSAWDFFRLGVVPAPEIGLQDLKARSINSANKNSVSRNSSSGSSNNSTFSAKMNDGAHHGSKSNHSFKQLVGKGGGLLSGCKCSIETIESDIVMIKNSTKSTNKTENATHAMKEKVLELKRQKQRQKQGKKAMSRRRTFEWLKDLPHASYPDEGALLSNT